MSRTPVVVFGLVALGLLPASAQSRSVCCSERIAHARIAPPTARVGATAPSQRTRPPAITGSTIATFAGDILVIDGDSGKLVRVDDDGPPSSDGGRAHFETIAELALGSDVAQIVVDAPRARAYVSDRERDRVVVVDLKHRQLVQVGEIPTDAEPFGLALSADGRTLLVTAVADHTVTAFDPVANDPATPRWGLDVGPEPRGVAISPDGHHAIVTFLTSGVVAHLEGLGRNPDVDFVSIDPVRSTAPATERSAIQVHHRKPGSKNSAIVPANLSHPDPDPDLGRGFSRNAFAVTFVGDEVAVIAHQVSTPHLDSEGEAEVRSGGYGGGDGFTPPVSHQLVFLRLPTNGNPSARVGSETIPTHQPRALVYDPKADMLFVAGYGSDDVLALGEASQVSVHIAWERSLGRDCGPQGLAIGRDGQALVFCSLTRRIAQASPEKGLAFASGSLTESRLSKAAQRGRALFRAGGDPKISARGSLACSSCHAEGRADGLSWFLQGDRLQTPFLNGRLVGSHPFKWDGKDRDLGESLKNTVGRLGGSGISSTEANDLQAYLTSLPRPRSPHARDPQAVARGKALFDSPQTGCLRCHDGPLKSDGRRHNLARDLEEVDTPSLIGVAHSAPYYHDGSAQTLRAALKGNGSIHAMGRSAQLDDRQLGDLIAYLETL